MFPHIHHFFKKRQSHNFAEKISEVRTPPEKGGEGREIKGIDQKKENRLYTDLLSKSISQRRRKEKNSKRRKKSTVQVIFD